MLDLKDIKEYLGIDFEDGATNRRLMSLKSTSEEYIKSAIGDKCDFDNPKVMEIQRLVIYQLYEMDAVSLKESSSLKALMNSIKTQLRLET